MKGERVTISLTGGGPWGFRLYGGENDPLVVAKLRSNSKASNSGLREGDVLLAINNISCKGIDHPKAMAHIEHAGHQLTFEILRGSADMSDVKEAYESLSRTANVGNSSQFHNGFLTTEKKPSNSPLEISYKNPVNTFKVAKIGSSSDTSTKWKPSHDFSASIPKHSGYNSPHVFNADESKENIAPAKKDQHYGQSQAAAFNVKKIGVGNANKWSPGNIPVRRSNLPTKQFTPERTFQEPVSSAASDHMPLDLASSPFMDDGLSHVHLAKILHEGPGSDDSGNESPGTFWMRKKKIFADSSFYDDPQHKYPTIEEQIKMARKVALSLVAPANRNARGHRMFVRRKQKAVKWTTGMEPTDFDITSDEEEEKYYNPNPWSARAGPHTWQPPSHHSQPQSHQPSPPQQPYMSYKPLVRQHSPQRTEVPIPPAPPLPTAHTFMPKWRPAEVEMDVTDNGPKKEIEIENIRLHGLKSKHTNVPPQMAFSLAADMKKMKGKGGKLFAKRRERSEKWVVGETVGQAVADPAIMEKLVISAQLENPEMYRKPTRSNQPSSYSGGAPVNRLSEMINPPKPSMSPWDACADFGDVDKAFQHLAGYMAIKRGDYKSAVAQNLDKAAARSYMTPFRPGVAGTPVNVSSSHSLPRLSQLKPWQSTASMPNSDTKTSSALPFPTTNVQHQKANTENKENVDKQASNRKWTKSGMSDDVGLYFPSGDLYKASNPQSTGVFNPTKNLPSQTGGFRPVQFKPSKTNASYSREIGEEAGYCDL